MSESVHHYPVHCSWRGSTGGGYDGYDRAHEGSVPGVEAPVALSADTAFRGDATRLNPEALLVLATSSCQLLAFLTVAARARVDVVAYRDDAEGSMPEDDPPVRVTRIVLRPRITIRGDVAPARLAHLVEVAHRECYIANALRTEVVIDATFEIVG
jgi:organic hydroperoxide reductase OsmC/OhrA